MVYLGLLDFTDIIVQLKTNPNTISLKTDLHWIIEDNSYFEWFTKLLNEMKSESDIFNYHIYFPNKSQLLLVKNQCTSQQMQ